MDFSEAERDLLQAFEDAASLRSASKASSTSRPLPPHPLADITNDVAHKERAVLHNARSLDNAIRRVQTESEDRLAWLQRLKTAIADEEHCILQRRRSCTELQQISERHRGSIDQLVQRFALHNRDVFETLDEREAAVAERAAAVQARVDEVAGLIRVLDAREREATARSAELTRADAALDDQQVATNRAAREIKELEFDLQDRKRAVDRREEAIQLWEARLDRRDAELRKAAVAATHNASTRNAFVEVQSIDLDE